MLGLEGSYFTLAVWPAATRLRCSRFFEAGDVLGGFVGDAGNGVGVVEKLLRAVRRRRGWRAFRQDAGPFGARNVSIAGAVVNDFEDLAFDDAADAVQVGAALAFDVVCVVSGLRRSQRTMPTSASTAIPASGSHSCQSLRSSFNVCPSACRSFRQEEILPELEFYFLHRFAREHRDFARDHRAGLRPAPTKPDVAGPRDGGCAPAARTVLLRRICDMPWPYVPYTACAALLRGDDWIS